MSVLRDRLIKNSTVKLTDTLVESKVFNTRIVIPTRIPMINVALSGTILGGMTPGITMLAGPSKHFKTGFAMLLGASFLEKYPDGIILFYDTEFGAPASYFSSFGISPEKVVHTPITDIEQLKFDIMAQLSNIEKGDRVMIIIDSIGNIASKKEVDDALDQKSVADMTRAKQLKSLFRMITPHLSLKDIPAVVINHTYMTQEMYAKPVVSGGTGSYYGADNIWILGRRQDKDGTEVQGYRFVINVEKSRFVREKSQIPITVSFDGGINRWSGMFDVALELGYISSGKKGWYHVVDRDTGELQEPAMRASAIEESKGFWEKMLAETDLAEAIRKKYQLGVSMMITDGDRVEHVEELEEEIED